jgi:hypothetical protein
VPVVSGRTADWATISALATAGGTLVLAAATFASVRSGNRAASHPRLQGRVGGRTDLDRFRPQTRDLYIRAGDVGFWQGAVRDFNDPAYRELGDAIQQPHAFSIDVLYGDHEIGQRTISRFVVTPWEKGLALRRGQALEP